MKSDLIHDTSNYGPAESLRALCDAIQGAISALAAGSLVSFEDSLERQQELCQQLLLQRSALNNASRSGEVRALLGELRQLNQTYAHLVTQARLSNNILYQVCLRFTPPSPLVAPSAQYSLEA